MGTKYECLIFAQPTRNIISLQVSWIRHRDLHILTVGRFTYTADPRHKSHYNPSRDEWVLEIKRARRSDSGRYECQISTQPVRSFFVELHVVGESLRMYF